MIAVIATLDTHECFLTQEATRTGVCLWISTLKSCEKDIQFAARMRTPQNRGEVDREKYAEHIADMYMATYGLLHTKPTNVGYDIC